MKYKAVIFDLFGTLVHMASWHDREHNLRQVASVLSAPPGDFVQMWHDSFDERMNGIFRNNQECLRYICSELRLSPKESQIDLAAQIRFEMTKQGMRPKEDAIEVLNTLKSLGYRTGLISNASIDDTRVWADTPLDALIDVAVFSCLVSVRKPDPLIYYTVTKQLAVEPKECLYVADGIDGELAAALQIGMYPVQICTPDADDPYLEEWDGPSISSLKEVLDLLE
jgi:putative hydrolase of the HAD superfamily